MRDKLAKLVRCKHFNIGIISIFIAFVTFMQFQLSVSRIPFVNANMSIVAFLWNLFAYWFMLVILIVIFNRIHFAVLTWSILAFALSITNYYVLLLHGAPFTVHVLKNTGTTLNVISSYRFRIDKYSGLILFLFVLCIAVVVLTWKITKNKPITTSGRKRLILLGTTVVLLASSIYLGIFSPISFKPKNSIRFSWASSAGEYGFLALQLETHFQENTYTLAFDNYSEQAVYDVYDRIAAQPVQPTPEELPDIVLILNESFYDLEQVVDLETNIDPLENYYSIDNAVKGYVVASGEGGGTNRSEYELLTSVSTSILPNQTPFLALDLKDQHSVVTYIEEYGYETYAAHCAKADNYNRKYAYPTLGFDHSYFDMDFENLESYGNRANTDESTYRNLISWYEEPSDKPKFMYLLTYQNHGGWEQNPDDMDTVKVENDFGENTSQTNEYLSSLRLSDIELVKLLDYFETVDKPVIVCMLGDHGPSFAKLIADPSIPEEELTYKIKSTPLVIWSNYGLEAEDVGYISLNYVVPKLMEVAGLPLSPFYTYQLEIMDEVPVIISYNTFYDKNMEPAVYDQSSELTQLVQDYFNICFNSFQDEKLDKMFAPRR